MMRHLFSPEGKAALAEVMARRPLLAFDFDGTLAPIVPQPSQARLSSGMSSMLEALAQRWPVAIVTGRSVADVRGRLGFEPAYIVGNHGAEFNGGAESATSSAALDGLRQRVRQHGPELARAGVQVEDKGPSIAFHYRMAPSRALALEAIAEMLGANDPDLRVFGGKLVVNVVPRHAPDKADAVLALMDRSGADCVVFAGDDINDEPVFAAASPTWLTVRVGYDATASRAMYGVRGPDEIAQMVAKMLALAPPATPS